MMSSKKDFLRTKVQLWTVWEPKGPHSTYRRASHILKETQNDLTCGDFAFLFVSLCSQCVTPGSCSVLVVLRWAL